MPTTNFPNGITSTTGFTGPLTGAVAATKFTGRTPVAVTANTTLTAADSGKTIFCNAADLVITLPSTSAGLNYQIVTGVASTGTGTSVSPAAADQIIGLGVTAADNKDLINSGASDAAGDMVELIGDGSAGWYVGAARGTWAREA